jgi:hypothetical protein
MQTPQGFSQTKSSFLVILYKHPIDPNANTSKHSESSTYSILRISIALLALSHQSHQPQRTTTYRQTLNILTTTPNPIIKLFPYILFAVQTQTIIVRMPCEIEPLCCAIEKRHREYLRCRGEKPLESIMDHALG